MRFNNDIGRREFITYILLSVGILIFGLQKSTSPKSLLTIKTEKQKPVIDPPSSVKVTKGKSKTKPIVMLQNNKAVSIDTLNIQPFNPNSVDSSFLLDIGIGRRAIKNWQKYLSAGGRFKDFDDIKKVYGLTSSEVNRLQDKLIFPKQSNKPGKKNPKIYLNKDVIINVNTADTEEWEKLKGIGPAYAKRICKFRDKLGGFYTIEQVAQTYGLPDSVYRQIKPRLILNGKVKKILINKSNFDALKDHPYISFKSSKILLKYIRQNGPIKNYDQLKSSLAFKPDELERISPYISYDSNTIPQEGITE